MVSLVAPLRSLSGLAEDMAGPFLRAFGGPPSRRVGGRTGRTHIEVRGMHEGTDDGSRRLLEKQLRAVPGVHDAVVNAALGRVVIDHDADLAITGLLRVVDEMEQTAGLGDAGVADTSGSHPADDVAVTRQLVALGLDTIGFGALAVERALTPLPAASLVVPPVVTVGLSLVDAVPALRGLAERTAGASSTESWFSVGSATVQAVGRGPFGLVADACYRVLKSGEAAARGQAWQRWDVDRDLADHRVEPCAARSARPGALPAGPIEWVGDGVGVAAVAGLGLAVALVPHRAVAVVAATVPKSARWGREAFAASAGRVLAERDVLVLDSTALRRADRVDVVVVDPALLRRPGFERIVSLVGEVVPAQSSAARDRVVEWQERGHGVALIAGDGATGEALDAADVAVAVRGAGALGEQDGEQDSGEQDSGASGEAAWYADLVCTDAETAAAVLAVIAAARPASRRAAVLALLASGVAMPVALLDPLPWHQARASTAVTLGALLSLGVGAWSGSVAARR